jgi:hypothetical protein
MRFQFSSAPEPPSVIAIIQYLSLSGTLDSRIVKEFRIFTESTMLSNYKSIAKDNCYQILDFPGTDPAHNINNHPGIGT